MGKLRNSSNIAIVAALEREVRPLIRKWRATEKEYAGRRFRFFQKDEIVLVCGGMGAEAARRAAEAVIALYEPRMICSAGFAGALDPALKVGDVVQPRRVVNARDGSSVSLAGSEGGAAELRSAGQPHSTPPHDTRGRSGQAWAAVPTCVLVSFEAVASPAQKAKLRDSFGAQAVDMEAAAVASAAEARGVAFSVVKVISDDSEFMFPALERFAGSDGHFQEARFALFALFRPWLWPQVLRLATNSRRASRALCDRLQNMSRNPVSASGNTLEVVNRQ